MDVGVAATTNWNVIGGPDTDVTKVIQTKIPDTEIFVKPHVDDILSTESAILLSSGTDTNQPTCEFRIRVMFKYKIDSLTVLCTSPKIELFSGEQCEYVETIYGERLDDEEENNDIEGYRYDFEIRRSGVTHLMLKLITNLNELCIYGVQLNVAPNPNGITTLLPNSINLDNVKEMLNYSNQKLSPSAEKCKMFLESYNHALSSGLGGSKMNVRVPEDTKRVDLKTECLDNKTSSQVVKAYVDVRMLEMENRILKRLDDIEETQNRKLDKILKLLEAI